MVLKLFLLGIAVFAVIGIFGNFSQPGIMTNTIQNIQTSFVTITYAGEFNEINNIVQEFIVLRETRSGDDTELRAAKLDEKINNLGLVKKYCNVPISTLELIYEQDPYSRLQQICPSLKDVSFSKAVQLFRMV